MKIVILTAEPKNFVPVELKKEAEGLKHEVEIIDVRNTFIVETTGKSKVMYKVDDDKLAELKPPFACIPRLNEHHIMYKLNVLNRLVADGAFMVNTPESMGLCNDKLGSQVALNSAGIQTPYSTVIGSPDMLDLTLKQVEEDGQLKFPMIIKTLRGTHGIGVMKVDSKSSLVSVAQAFLANSGSEVMLQEFIEHEESLRIIMIGDELLAANRRGQPKEKDEFRTNSHLGSETQKYEPNEEELALARKIVELFGCRFCAIDYIQHNGQLIVLEVNGSPGLEAIQKNWEDKNLPKAVIEGLVKLSGDHEAHEAPFVPGAGEPKVVDGMYDGIPVSEPKIAPMVDPAIPGGIEGSLDVPHNDVPVQVVPNVNADVPLGDTEQLVIVRLADDGLHARVDTGAAYCSLHADRVEEANGSVKFKRGDVTYRVPVERKVKIRNAHGSSERPLVKLDIVLRGVRHNQVEFSIVGRGHMKYDALIGRNLLKVAGIPVLVPNDDAQRAGDLPPSELEVDEE